MKKLILLLAATLSLPIFAQEDTEVSAEEENSVVDGIVAKQHIKNKRHMEAAYVREANVLWSKTIWRIIDLHEKQNLYLYYPTVDVDGRRSLVKVLFDGIKSGELTAYRAGLSNEFDEKMNAREVFEKFNIVGEMESVVPNPETGENDTLYRYDYTADAFLEVYQFLVKEVWFFDRKYSRMNCKIIGLCPITEKVEEGRLRKAQSFWIYYPQAAQMLSEQEAFTFKNDAQRQSLYDMLEQRRFGSYIFKESNVYNDRVITNYTQGMSSNIEWENIQNAIFEKEHDMWEF